MGVEPHSFRKSAFGCLLKEGKGQNRGVWDWEGEKGNAMAVVVAVFSHSSQKMEWKPLIYGVPAACPLFLLLPYCCVQQIQIDVGM
jgi:hypothetical protein